MTEPQPVMAQAEQDQLTRQVGRALLGVAGDGWQQVRAEYRSAGRHIEVDVHVKGPDGVERSIYPPQEVVDGLGRLRQGMYRPGRGTWLSALYVLDPPSAFNAEFEPDVEPRWRRVPPPIGFADELRFYPRDPDHIPEWLRQRAGLPPAPGTQEAGQGNAPGGQAGSGNPAGPGGHGAPGGGQAGPGGPAAPGGGPAGSGGQAGSGNPAGPGSAPAVPSGGPGGPGNGPGPGGHGAPVGPGGRPAAPGEPPPFNGPPTPPRPQGLPTQFSGQGPASPPRGFPPPRSGVTPESR